MHETQGLLQDLAVVLTVAAATTVLFARLRLPVVLGYLLAGLLVSPSMPLPLVADVDRIELLSELGVIVLLFSIGLEFSVGKLLRLGPSAGVIATVEVGLMLWLGFLVGRLFGFDAQASLFVAGSVAISSTMIVARALGDGGGASDRGNADLVFGILIVEDLFAILLLAALSALAAGAGLSAGEFVLTGLRLFGFLVLMVAAGLLFVPRAMAYVSSLGSRETTLVAAVGTCFALALLSRLAGYSVALGAFTAGLLVAESGEGRRVELLMRPLRDVFGAVFFVSVGMQIEPALVLAHWPAVLALTGLVLVGKVLGVSVGALIVGHRTETAVRAGMSLAQIGEFSFLIAGLALEMGPQYGFLPPIAVAVSVITAFLTPVLTRRAPRIGQMVDQRLPKPLRTFLSLYASWLDGMRSRGPRNTLGARVRRLILWLVVDAAILVAVVIGVAVSTQRMGRLLAQLVGERPLLISVVITGVELLALLPFAFGIVRCVRLLGVLLAFQVLPQGGVGLDLAAAPRRALVAGLQFALLLVVLLPVLALTQPFLPPLPGIGLLLTGLAVAFWGLWRSATNLEGHVRAGAAMVLEVLARQSREARAPELESLSGLLPGLGRLRPVGLEAGAAAVGRTIAELNLHGRSGASILCVSRGGDGVIAPAGDVRLQAGDVLTLTGNEAAVSTAQELLRSRGPTSNPPPL